MLIEVCFVSRIEPDLMCKYAIRMFLTEHSNADVTTIIIERNGVLENRINFEKIFPKVGGTCCEAVLS